MLGDCHVARAGLAHAVRHCLPCWLSRWLCVALRALCEVSGHACFAGCDGCVDGLAFLIGAVLATRITGPAQHSDVERFKSKLGCFEDGHDVVGGQVVGARAPITKRRLSADSGG